jgi:hypothetical protein
MENLDNKKKMIQQFFYNRTYEVLKKVGYTKKEVNLRDVHEAGASPEIEDTYIECLRDNSVSYGEYHTLMEQGTKDAIRDFELAQKNLLH